MTPEFSCLTDSRNWDIVPMLVQIRPKARLVSCLCANTLNQSCKHLIQTDYQQSTASTSFNHFRSSKPVNRSRSFQIISLIRSPRHQSITVPHRTQPPISCVSTGRQGHSIVRVACVLVWWNVWVDPAVAQTPLEIVSVFARYERP